MTKPAGRTLWPTFPAPASGRKALAVHTPWGFTPKHLLVLIAALVAAAAVAVGAAWLTGPHTGSARQATVSTVSQPGASAVTAGQLAARAGCTHWVESIPAGLYTQTEGGCVLPGGGQLTLATFGDAAAQKDWMDAEAELGGYIVQGSGWAANAATAADARTVVAKESR